MIWIALAFLCTAALYASVGFGGGSTYIAILALAESDYRTLPILALICNILVVAGGSIRFQFRGLIDWPRVWPILLFSVPAAWVGGYLSLNQSLFMLLLGCSLLAASLLIFAEPFINKQKILALESWSQNPAFSVISGSAIGLLSGMVGIGGGIFLAPVLILTNWAKSRIVAATASLFILANSLAGLIGQIMKANAPDLIQVVSENWLLFIAVLIGGQIGSILASKSLPDKWIRRITALLILYVACRILWQQLS